jgi:hypothetical protein
MREFVHAHSLLSRVLAAFLIMYGCITELAGYGEGGGIGHDISLTGIFPLAIGIALAYACSLPEP